MGHNLGLHFKVDEHPFATYVDVHQGYRVLTHSHVKHVLRGTSLRHVTAMQPRAS